MFVSIDIIKAFACLMIVNFHCLYIYPNSLKFLSFGGDLGNNVFFLVSGFLLMSSISKTSFSKMGGWIKKRMLRILPICSLFNLLVFLFIVKERTPVALLRYMVFPTAYWFTGAIILFYPLIFFIEKIENKAWVILLIVLLLLIHVVFDSLYVERYVMGFLAMITGCEMRTRCDFSRREGKNVALLISPFALLVYVLAKLLYARGVVLFGIVHLVIGITTIVFAALIVIGLVREEERISTVRDKRIYKGIALISGMTLHLYLCQQLVNKAFLESFLVVPFPVSFIIYLVVVFLFASCVWRLDEIIHGKNKRVTL